MTREHDRNGKIIDDMVGGPLTAQLGQTEDSTDEDGHQIQSGEDFRRTVADGELPFYRRKHLFTLVAAVVIILDQITKWRIESTIPLNTSVAPIPNLYPYFQYSHVANTGMAFGLFPWGKTVFTILAIFVSIGIAYMNFQLPAPSFKLRLTLGLLFAGAVGNLLSRLRLGHVTDFMNFNLRPLFQSVIDIPILDWPVFNVADMAISSGIALMLYIMWREPELTEIETPGPITEIVNSE